MPIPHGPVTPITINAAGQHYRQTASFIYLGGAVTETPNLSSTYYYVAKYIALVGATERLLLCLLCWNRFLLFHETALPGAGHSQRDGGRDGTGSRWRESRGRRGRQRT